MKPISIDRRDFLRGLGISASGLFMTSCFTKFMKDGEHPPRRPNVVIFFTDDQRFDTIGALGHPVIKTPNMDRFVRNGTSFTHTYIMGSPHGAVCMPSRAMLLTGRGYFHLPRSVTVAWSVKPEERGQCPYITFPEVFQRQGYATFGTGKWHNGSSLYARGFTHGGKIFFGGMSDHLKVPLFDFDLAGEYPKRNRYTGDAFSSTLFSDAAINFLTNRNGTRPFLMYVSYTAPHDPRMAPKAFQALYPPEEVDFPPNFFPEHPFDNGELRVRDENLAPFPRTEKEVRKHIADYYAMISHTDHEIGRVMAALEESGEAENTLVVLAGDNGLAVGQHGLLGKQSLYEHSVRVPLVISGPAVPKGKRIDALCYLHDLFPTLCDLSQIDIPGSVESRSLYPLMHDKTPSVRDSLFFAYSNKKPQRGIRAGRWKLIKYNIKGNRTTQLFDLEEDPWEKKNLADDPAFSDRCKQMEKLLRSWMERSGDPVLWEDLVHEKA